jgi:fructose-bisphosphate aldolase, class II
LGAFNLDDELTSKAVARATQKKRTPVLVEVSQEEVDDLGLDIRDLVDNFKNNYILEIYINFRPQSECRKRH